MELTLSLAFIAGLISFISPCVLPLVPAYIGYMGGRMTHTVALSTTGEGQAVLAGRRRFIVLTHSLFFVAGFTFVFVSIGLLSTAFLSTIGGGNISTVTDLIGRVGGVVIILFGLHFMGVLPRWLNRIRSNDSMISSPLTSVVFALVGTMLILWGFSGNAFVFDSVLWDYAAWAPTAGIVVMVAFLLWLVLDGAFTQPARFWRNLIDRMASALYADTRRDMQVAQNGGLTSSALMGVVFAAGWTPCIGPVYGSVLTMAANATSGSDIGQAGVLLTVYSLGLGIPFMLTAFALDSAQSILRRMQRHMHRIELASGTFLVVIGIAIASGQLQSLSQQFSAGQFAEFAISVEDSVIGAISNPDQPAQVVEPTAASATATPQGSGSPETRSSDLLIINPDTTASQANARANVIAAVSDAAESSEPGLSSIVDLADQGSPSPSVGISLGNLAPDFESVGDSGQPIRLSDYRGQVVVLNFWATWCEPCRVEMPEFESVFNQRKDQGLVVLAVNNGETAASVQSFRQEIGLNFPLVMDESASIQTRYNIFSYPSTFILNREGIIVDRSYGPLTASKVDEMIRKALAT